MDGALNVDWSEQGACSESTLPGAGTVSAELAPINGNIYIYMLYIHHILTKVLGTPLNH